MLVVTTNVDLNWDAYINPLHPGDKLYIIGVASQIKATVFPLTNLEKFIRGSPIGSPATISIRLDFCSRYNINPMIEEIPISSKRSL